MTQRISRDQLRGHEHPSGDHLDQTELREQLLRTLDEARGMSEVEFRTRQRELIEQVVPAELISPPMSKLELQMKAVRWLLSPTAIEIIEKKFSQ